MRKNLSFLLFFCFSALANDSVDLKKTESLANQGDAKAQVNLGIMYANGNGVRQDNVKAKEYFGLSCDNGAQLGCDYYAEMNTK